MSGEGEQLEHRRVQDAETNAREMRIFRLVCGVVMVAAITMGALNSAGLIRI